MNQRMWALLMGVFLTAGTAASSPNPLEIYQRALVQEQAAGDLPEAMELYEQAAKEAGTDRGLAARALIRAAGCAEKLGQPAAATGLYTQVMHTFPEQREKIALAQARLAALKRPASQHAETHSAQSGRPDVSACFVEHCRSCDRCRTGCSHGEAYLECEPGCSAPGCRTTWQTSRPFSSRAAGPADAAGFQSEESVTEFFERWILWDALDKAQNANE